MINGKCFSETWLQQKKQELRTDPYLLERALHAFALLGHLAESGLNFVFKGGTSLLLHVPVIRRLSIDIDILCTEPAEHLEHSLRRIAGTAPFVGFEEDDRGFRGLPHRRHFKFYYQPILHGNPAPFVILDVVEESAIPHDIIAKPIAPAILDIQRQILVNIPTVESLLADKLTAFAPKTIGVPLVPPNNRPADTMQIIKQLFDIGELFDVAEDVAAIRRVYHRVFTLENEYRGGAFRPQDALDDTWEAALRIALHKLKGVPDHSEAVLLLGGVGRLASHLVNHRFDPTLAKIAAAKAALLSRLIARDDTTESLSHWRSLPELAEIAALTIKGEWSRLQRLRNTSPQAFVYWYRAAELHAA